MTLTHIIRFAQVLAIAAVLAALAAPALALGNSNTGKPATDWFERYVAAHPYGQASSTRPRPRIGSNGMPRVTRLLRMLMGARPTRSSRLPPKRSPSRSSSPPASTGQTRESAPRLGPSSSPCWGDPASSCLPVADVTASAWPSGQVEQHRAGQVTAQGLVERRCHARDSDDESTCKGGRHDEAAAIPAQGDLRIDPAPTLAGAFALVAQARPAGTVSPAGGWDRRSADVTFTKWLTNVPNAPSAAGASMAGVVGGDVGPGIFAGKVLSEDTSQPPFWLAQLSTDSKAASTRSSRTTTSRRTTGRARSPPRSAASSSPDG